jgi:hypothetical protein
MAAEPGDTLPPRDELTTNRGVAVSDDQNSLKSHVRGPTLLEDILMGGHAWRLISTYLWDLEAAGFGAGKEPILQD